MAVLPARAALEAIVQDPKHALVAVDFDGTLAPVAERPEQAYASPTALAALGRLGSVVGTVAIITGRAPRMVLELADVASVPGLADLIILGQYGVERWDAATGVFVEPPPPDGIEHIKNELPGLLDEVGVPAELEFKGRAIGVHLRNVPSGAQAQQRLEGPLRQLAHRHGLSVQPGRLILEVCAHESDKGQALQRLIVERGATSVVYAGDDLGDLPAFETIHQLRADGFPGLAVCVASPEQQSLIPQADVVVDDVPGVTRWLTQLADAMVTT